jgi:hypothetical protein
LLIQSVKTLNVITDYNNLHYLDCSYNQLSELDISQCRNVLDDMWENPVSLNLSYMPTLTQVCVWELPFPPKGWEESMDTTGSTNVYFATECTLASAENSWGGLSIYPNPTDGILILELVSSISGVIEILNLSDEVIHRKQIQSTTEQIDMTPYSDGIYFVKVRSDRWMRTKKIVKY